MLTWNYFKNSSYCSAKPCMPLLNSWECKSKVWKASNYIKMYKIMFENSYVIVLKHTSFPNI
jgi:hypothetical protein